MRRIFWRYALWMIPVTIVAEVSVYLLCTYIQYPAVYPASLLFIVTSSYYVYVLHRHSYEHHYFYKDDFSPKAQADWRRLELSREKLRSLYRCPRRENVFRKPNGMVLGKIHNQYVCVPIDKNNIVSMCLIGAPGSGKSSGPFTSSLANIFTNQPDITAFVIDIKGELAELSVRKDNPHVRIINPEDMNSFGWDPYYNLTQSSSDDEILDCLDKLARSLIIDANPKNAFFVNSSRRIFKAVLLFYFHKVVWTGTDGLLKSGFVDSILEILSSNLSDLVNSILSDDNICSQHPQIRAMLNEFSGDSESEVMQGIRLQLLEHLDIFTRTDIMRMFSPSNPRRASPLDLNTGISIFLCVPENKLDVMATVFRMIVYQILSEMECRLPDSNPCLILLDELPRLNKIDKLTSSLATLRSRRVSCWLIFQDLSLLQQIYGHDTARIILNLCEVTCVLSCRDIETGKMLSEWSGYYEEKRRSRTSKSRASAQAASVSTSSERRPVVEISDIMRLRTEGGIMLWIEGRYCRAQRIRYFEDKRIREIVNENVAYNRALPQTCSDKQDFTNEILFFDDGTLTNDEDVSQLTDSVKAYQLALNSRSEKPGGIRK